MKKSQYLTAKLVCIKDGGSKYYTTGAVYKIKNGVFAIPGVGSSRMMEVHSVQELNREMSSQFALYLGLARSARRMPNV